MSIKYVCDVCGKESETGINKFKYLCHLKDKNPLHGYSDNEGNSISGREDSVDLCNKCYNYIVSAAIEKMEKMKNEN